ncbi:MAG: polysaccharide deacetylase family protein [Hyphomicrobiaceae bacterium]|nr:MAG: polysaccharide deacetylase family protein [Hyphomicrobiaceae bacterium]
MSNRHLICCAAALAGALAAPQAARADGRAALQAACWAPSALAARPGERTPVRLSRPASMRVPNVAGVQEAPTRAAIAGAVRRVALPPGRKLVALTFDLCETPGETAGYDGAIVDYLRSQRIKATFFAGGQWMASHKARTGQLLSDPLFEIGTHGWAHRNTRLLGGAELKREILAPSLVYAAIRTELGQAQCAAPHAASFSAIPARPALFRFPFGACNAAGLQAAADHGLVAIQWDVSTGDPSPGQSARAIADLMIRNARPGSIIIAHANGRGYHTAAALPLAIPALKAKGFEFVTVSELLAAGKPVVTDTCYDSRPGDTDKYDFLLGRRLSSSLPREPSPDHARAAPTLPR